MYQKGDKVIERNGSMVLVGTILEVKKGIWPGNNQYCYFCTITYNENGIKRIAILPDWRLQFASEEERR